MIGLFFPSSTKADPARFFPVKICMRSTIRLSLPAQGSIIFSAAYKI